MSGDNFWIKNRKLPHWRLLGAIYFITFRVLNNIFLSKNEQIITVEHIISGNNKYYSLLAAVVMPDHVHLILKPEEKFSLSRILKGIKGVSARKINILRRSRGNIWQDESYDRIIRNEKELHEIINYMYNNPVKKGFIENPDNYYGWYYNQNFT